MGDANVLGYAAAVGAGRMLLMLESCILELIYFPGEGCTHSWYPDAGARWLVSISSGLHCSAR